MLGWAQFGAPMTPYTLWVLTPNPSAPEVAPAIGGVRAGALAAQRRFRLKLSLEVFSYREGLAAATAAVPDGIVLIANRPPPADLAQVLRAFSEATPEKPSIPIALIGEPAVWPEAVTSVVLDDRLLVAQLVVALQRTLRPYENDVAIVIPEDSERFGAPFQHVLGSALRDSTLKLDLRQYGLPADPALARNALAQVVKDDSRKHLDLIMVLDDAPFTGYTPLPWESHDYRVIAIIEDLRALRHLASGQIDYALSPDRFSLGKAAMAGLIEAIHLGRAPAPPTPPPWREINAENLEQVSREWSEWVE